jgi:protein involved in polysaccharide export with SLBB domain
MRWITLGALVALFGVFLAGASSGQTKPAPGDYVLGPDDVIEVSVLNHEDLNKLLVVLPDGKIIFPDVGEIMAAGKTPKQLAADIQKGLEKVRNNVSVAVLVKEIHSRKVRVIGAVRGSAGAYDLKQGGKLIDIIAQAGGLVTKPSRVSAKLIRNGTQIINLDLVEALAHPDGPANVPLEPDDLIILDEAEPSRNQVNVMGEVGKQGAYELDPGVDLAAIIVQAGGPTDKAALSKAYVLRDKKEIPVNLYPVFAESKLTDPAASFKLKPGDVVVIPPIETRYAVMGQVGHPGYYVLPERKPVTVMDALNLAGAGGQGSLADMRRVGVIRTVNGKPTVTEVNVEQMLKTHDLSKNVAIQPNDIVYVPAKSSHAFNWLDILYPLSIFSTLTRF